MIIAFKIFVEKFRIFLQVHLASTVNVNYLYLVTQKQRIDN
jgi:hypothetical protein